MEDKNKQLDSQHAELKTGSGSLLSAARKQQNRTVEEIADELNLSVTQIKTIELDQSEGLPEPTYVRGYIRSYARLLGLDAEQVLENYLNPNWQKSTSLDDMPKGIGSADDADSSSFFTPAKVIVLLVLIASFTFLWSSGLLKDILGLSKDQPAVVASTDSASSAVNEAPVTNTEVQVNTQASTPEVEASVLPSGPTDSEGQNALVLSFAETSWVDIRDSDNKRLAYQSYAQGEELAVESLKTMSVFIGNANGVTARYNGADFDLSPYREGIYAKFTLKPRGVQQ